MAYCKDLGNHIFLRVQCGNLTPQKSCPSRLPPGTRLPLSPSFPVQFSNATWQTSLPSKLIDPRIRERFAMTHRLFLLICAISLFCLGLSPGTLADNSHARIVRLSLVQSDVRFAPSFREYSLTVPYAR